MALHPFVCHSGGPDSAEIVIAFEGRPDPIPLMLYFTEETVCFFPTTSTTTITI